MLQEVVILALAVFAVTHVWFNGSIFAQWRSYWQVRGGFFGELLTCALCLSFWITGFIVLANAQDVKWFVEILSVWGLSRIIWLSLE